MSISHHRKNGTKVDSISPILKSIFILQQPPPHPANPFLLDLKADYGALFSFFPSLPPQRHSAHLGSQVPPSPSWLSYWSADPHCPTSSICYVTPTVRWQAWPGQIAERNALSRNHKDRKIAFHHFVEHPCSQKKPQTQLKICWSLDLLL